MAEKLEISDVARLEYGASLPERDRRPGAVPVYGSNGVVGYHDTAYSPGPGVIVGRKGSVGEVHYSAGPFWPIDTTYFVDRKSCTCDLKWLHLVLKAANLQSLNKATGVPGLDRSDVHALTINVPPPEVQISLARKAERQLQLASEAQVRCVEQVQSASLVGSRFLRESFPVATPIFVGDTPILGGSTWRIFRLDDLARLESGHTPSRRHPEWWGGPIPWLALPDIRRLHGKFVYETLETTNDAGLANSSARLLPVGTVCVSRTASIGFVTVLGRPMATSQDFCNWICDPGKLDAEFLMYAFMASHDYLRELGSGAVHKTIYMPAIQSFQVCAPPIEEQRRIAGRLRELLAAAEALTTGLRTRLAEIELLPQRILAAAFGSPA